MTFDVKAILAQLRETKYNSLNPNKRVYNITLNESNAKPIYKDIIAGLYIRYFASRANLIKTGPVIEIDKRQYDGLQGNSRFITARLEWRIVGPKKDEITYISGKEVINSGVESINRAVVESAAEQLPALLFYVTQYDEYYQEPTS